VEYQTSIVSEPTSTDQMLDTSTEIIEVENQDTTSENQMATSTNASVDEGSEDYTSEQPLEDTTIQIQMAPNDQEITSTMETLAEESEGTTEQESITTTKVSLGPTMIGEPPMLQYFKVGQPFVLVCSALAPTESTSPLQYSWTRNGRPLLVNDPVNQVSNLALDAIDQF
jgi:hypothetical protein